jgi:transposase
MKKRTNKRTDKNCHDDKQAQMALPEVREAPARHEGIYVGLDVHADHIRVVRQIDQANAQPAQRLGWDRIEGFCRKQLEMAQKVYAVYEAGAFGYGLYRRLRKLGVECHVIRPRKLDPDNKRVQTDKTDARELCDMLWRYVRGNTKAMSVVHAPTEEQEAKRVQGRHRKHLQKEFQSLAAHGRGLLLFHGFPAGLWWKGREWEELSGKLGPELHRALDDCRKLLEEYEKLLKPVEKELRASAPSELPLAMGALTFVLLMREVYDWKRFKNRRQVGSFMGLCGGVASSGRQHYDLSITKSGSSYLRTLLIEMAWRMVRYQPGCKAVQRWRAILLDPKTHRRHRKRAIVALARQLAVDIWKWQTGRATAQELGWKLITNVHQRVGCFDDAE